MKTKTKYWLDEDQEHKQFYIRCEFAPFSRIETITVQSTTEEYLQERSVLLQLVQTATLGEGVVDNLNECESSSSFNTFLLVLANVLVLIGLLVIMLNQYPKLW